MDRNEQQIIDGLFDRLRQAQGGSPPREPSAQQRIEDHLSRQPAAPYYMAQAIVVQEQALQAAQGRIQELEQEVTRRPSAGGGFLGGLFGAGSAPVPRAAPSPQAQQMARYQQQGGGGFLAGAMQTAMGVAGGMMLGNMLMGAFGGNEAVAAEPAAAPEESDPGADFGGFEEEF